MSNAVLEISDNSERSGENTGEGNLSEAILIDVSAFCRNPFLTGIQRQLEALLRYRCRRPLLPFVVEDKATIRVLPQRFFNLVEEFFKSGEDELTEARVAYHGSHNGRNNYYCIIRHYAQRFGKLYGPDPLFREIYAVLNTEYILDENYLEFYSVVLPKFEIGRAHV